MNTVHRKAGIAGDLEINSVMIRSMLFGRTIEISISVYNFGSPNVVGQRTAVTFGMRPAAENELGALRDGMLRLSEPNRVLEQRIELPSIAGQILDYSDLTGATNVEGRAIATAFLRKFESIFETCRQYLLKRLASDARPKVQKWLQQVYGKASRDTTCDIFKDVNWKFLFPESHCGAEMIGVVDYVLKHNPLEAYDITVSEPHPTIPVLSNEVIKLSANIADLKAAALLAQIVGTDEIQWYRKFGYIRLEAFGYSFQIYPNKWVSCTDRGGKSAQLCIHTVGFSCNPLDEMVIAYLHLKHKQTFIAYMTEAIAHHVQDGFVKIPETL